MRNTARVMREVEADVLAVVEAESRPVLARFNAAFHHVMVIDGNDERGIDVGIVTGRKFPIGIMRSHVDDRLPNGETVFSRDCPEFTLETPGGKKLVVMVNQLQKQGIWQQGQVGCQTARTGRASQGDL